MANALGFPSMSDEVGDMEMAVTKSSYMRMMAEPDIIEQVLELASLFHNGIKAAGSTGLPTFQRDLEEDFVAFFFAANETLLQSLPNRGAQ